MSRPKKATPAVAPELEPIAHELGRKPLSFRLEPEHAKLYAAYLVVIGRGRLTRPKPGPEGKQVWETGLLETIGKLPAAVRREITDLSGVDVSRDRRLVGAA
jgi:hypothetical protein